MSSILDIVYASAPSEHVLIPTLELKHAGAFDPIYICAGFEDQILRLENMQWKKFIATGLDIALPEKNATGQQHLTFAVDNVMGEIQRAIDMAIYVGGKTNLIYRTYLSTDKSAPAAPAIEMVVVGAVLSGSTAQIQASYHDLLNYAWPRDRYTTKFAPGLKYIT